MTASRYHRYKAVLRRSISVLFNKRNILLGVAVGIPVYLNGLKLPNFDARLDNAAARGHVTAVNTYVYLGMGHAENYPSLLTTAVAHGRTDVVKALFSHDINFSETIDAALIIAAHEGHREIVPLLLDHGADIHAAQGEALFRAAACGDTEIVRLLLARDANEAVSARALRAALGNEFSSTASVIEEHVAARKRQARISTPDGPT